MIRPSSPLTMLLSRHTRRRAFITLLGGTAAAWPLVVRAQQGDRMRRIGVLMSLAADDSETQARHAAFLQGLQQLGWTDGRNARIEFRGATDAGQIRSIAGEMGRPGPDGHPASGHAVAGPTVPATRNGPVVIVPVGDSVGAGFFGSLSPTGGNATGFSVFEYSM